ncbi:MAG: hypothetical protein NTW16_09335 [Bacteroidetes bacterium]|nr:hypothetical protein [Bacteroidota bacterium]
MKHTIYTLIILLFTILTATAQETRLIPKVDHAVYFDISPPLRDMLKEAMAQSDGSWKDKVVDNFVFIDGVNDKRSSRNFVADPGLQNSFGNLQSDTTIQNFEGMGNLSGYVPPDTHGDVGFNHYFQVINCSYAVYNKSGAKIFGPAPNSSVWSGMPNNSNDGDAIVLFDELANRWIFSQFSLPNGSSTAPFYQMIAVSQTPDPTGSWYRWTYEFSSMPDYPKFGIWPDAYYMSTNNFAGGWVGNGAYSYDRAAMLAGSPDARRISFNLSPGSDGFISLLPSDCDGAFPALGTPDYFIYIATNGTQRLGIYEFHSDWGTPANSTFGNLAYLNVNPYGPLGWGDKMLNHSVDGTSSIAGIRSYELRNTGTAWSIYQQSTYSPDSHSRWMGSIAQDTAGTISLGYSVSSASIYPGIRYTGRLKTDPLNQMTMAEKTIMNGGGSPLIHRIRQLSGTQRSIMPQHPQAHGKHELHPLHSAMYSLRLPQPPLCGCVQQAPTLHSSMLMAMAGPEHIPIPGPQFLPDSTQPCKVPGCCHLKRRNTFPP